MSDRPDFVFVHRIEASPELIRAITDAAAQFREALRFPTAELSAAIAAALVALKPSEPIQFTSDELVAHRHPVRAAEIGRELPASPTLESPGAEPMAPAPQPVTMGQSPLVPAPAPEPQPEAPRAPRPTCVAPCVPAAAPGQPAAPAEETRKFTPARREIIRARWPLGDSPKAIIDACNELPGVKLTDWSRIAIEASKLGVKRPPGFQPPLPSRAPSARPPEQTPKPADPFPVTASLPEPKPAAPPPRIAAYVPPPAAAPKPQVPAAPAAVAPSPRTAEREAKLRQCVALGDGVALIASVLNSFPGPKMLGSEVTAWIDELGLRAQVTKIETGVKTKARQRVLEAAFAAGDPVEQIRAKLSALEGAPITTAEVVTWIAQLGLKRAITAAPPAPMDFNTALRWALDLGLKFPRICNDNTFERVVNSARVERGLRQWKIVEPRRNREKIPSHAIDAEARANAF